MRDIKLQVRRDARKSILRSLERELPSKLSASIHWRMLDELIQDHASNLPSGFLELVTELSARRSILAYFRLQQFGDPQLYKDPLTYSSVAAVLSFLRKFPFGKVADLDPKLQALQRFDKAERLCRRTNKRLIWFRNRGYRHNEKWRGLHSVLHTARLLISSWLGPLDLNLIYDQSKHGPGGASGVTGDETTAYFKFAVSRYSVSTRALPYAIAAIQSDQLWRRYVVNPDSILGDVGVSATESLSAITARLEVVDYNKVTFVPKTAQTHRAIAIEPLLNIYLQLGVGGFLRKVLLSQGINLRSQARNQQLAREGSHWYGEPCERPVTLDLSMASDTISVELVKELLPTPWYDLLNDLRSHYGVCEGESLHWAKFSSMGNGFTFQLETMIFLALSRSVALHLGYRRESVAVYGDDVIVPAGMALRLIDTLNYCGFLVNLEKSFFFGPFRESCGADWFEGRDVRPFFLKREIKTPIDVMFVLNSFGGYDGFYDRHSYRRNRKLNAYCLSHLPADVRDNLLGPRSENLEGHIHCPLDTASKSCFVVWDGDMYQWRYVSAVRRPVRRSGDAGPLYLQFMDRRSSGLRPGSSLDRLDIHLLALEVDKWANEPIDLGEVGFRNRTKLALASHTSNGWRND